MPTPSIDPHLCPLCGSANRCAMELERGTGQPQPPCWCMEQKIPIEILEQIPAQTRNLACVCAKCGVPLAEDQTLLSSQAQAQPPQRPPHLPT